MSRDPYLDELEERLRDTEALYGASCSTRDGLALVALLRAERAARPSGTTRQVVYAVRTTSGTYPYLAGVLPTQWTNNPRRALTESTPEGAQRLAEDYVTGEPTEVVRLTIDIAVERVETKERAR